MSLCVNLYEFVSPVCLCLVQTVCEVMLCPTLFCTFLCVCTHKHTHTESVSFQCFLVCFVQLWGVVTVKKTK